MHSLPPSKFPMTTSADLQRKNMFQLHGFHSNRPTPLLVLLVLFCVVGCLHAPSPERVAADQELERLTATLESAMTQGDMNRASGKIAEFWDAQLAAIEQRRAESLQGEQKTRFAESQAAWRQYRIQQVESRSEIFTGGSIRPLIKNRIYAELTERRVKELESSGAQAQQEK